MLRAWTPATLPLPGTQPPTDAAVAMTAAMTTSVRLSNVEQRFYEVVMPHCCDLATVLNGACTEPTARVVSCQAKSSTTTSDAGSVGGGAAMSACSDGYDAGAGSWYVYGKEMASSLIGLGMFNAFYLAYT
jgi:hypothetical protein